MEKLGTPEEAFRLFGHETLVKGRNHHRVLRREMDKVAELCRAIGENPETLPGEEPTSE